MFSTRQRNVKARPGVQRSVVWGAGDAIFVQCNAGIFSFEFRRCATRAVYLQIVDALKMSIRAAWLVFF